MEKLLEVQSIETRKSDKTGVEFKVVTFKGVKFLGDRKVKTNVTGTRNFWPDHEVTLADGTKQMIKGDIEFATVMTGDFFDGSVQSFTTMPYQVEGRTLNQYKCVVFSHENGLAVAARNLRQSNSAPLDDDGNAYQLSGQSAGQGQQRPAAVAETIEP